MFVRKHKLLIIYCFCFLGFLMAFQGTVYADPFEAIAEKINITTRGVLKIGTVALSLSGAILLLQGIFGRINYKWGISLLIAALLMASFQFVVQFILGTA